MPGFSILTREEWLQPPEYLATIPTLLRRAVEQHGERDFLATGTEHISFAEAERKSALLAGALMKQGVGKGTRVGILMPNTPDWLVAFLAVTRIGAVAILMSTLYQRRDLAWVLRHGDIDTLLMVDRYLGHDYIARLEEIEPGLAEQSADAKIFVKSLPFLRHVCVWGNVPRWAMSPSAFEEQPRTHEFVAAAEELVSPADLCLVIYTSGSTAEPKGVVHAHGPIVRRPHMVRGQKMYQRDDRLLQLGPFCWIGGVLAVLWALEYGFCVICPPDPKIESIVSTIKQYAPTRIQAQPGKIRELRSHPELGGPRFSFLDGERDENGEIVPIDQFSRGLGMTETVAMHSLELWGKIPAARLGAFGRGVPDIERRIRDGETGEWVGPDLEGDLWVRGAVLLGLYKHERHEVFDPDGFYPTGDRCRIDQDGYLYYSGRGGEMIKTAGANVSPREVELLLETFPLIAEAGVFALPGKDYDQVVAAVIIPKLGATVDPEDLRRKLRGEISAFKVPKVVFVETPDGVPRTRSGKLDKRAYAKTVASTMAASPESKF